jgi:YceI-like domain
MAAYYRDGERYPLDTGRSLIRFGLHNLGVPTLTGTLRPRAGEVIVGAESIVRAADFHIDASSIDVTDNHTAGEIIRWLFGDERNPVVTFTTTWARPVGHQAVELEGTLRMHGVDHLLRLRTTTGAWELGAAERSSTDESSGAERAPSTRREAAPHVTGSLWHRSAVHGVLDRKTWDSRHEIHREIANLLLGHDVHFAAEFFAGPKTNSPGV